MNLQSKIAVLIPDFFWSSIPYDGLSLFFYLSQRFNVSLLMFSNDIRLNKTVFRDHEKYRFESKHFHQPKLIVLKNWDEFYKKSADFDLIISGVHLAPKGERSESIKNFNELIKCKFMTIDIGGSDIFGVRHRGDYFCVKGPIWKTWLERCDIKPEYVFNTGSPHFDCYHQKILPEAANKLSEDKFNKKYKLRRSKNKLLIAPCNPKSHQEQFDTNLLQLRTLFQLAHLRNYEVLIKTYPSDYVFYDEQKPYSGIYHRHYSRKRPQYDCIRDFIPQAKILESQDHFAAVCYCHKLFNMSGSHIAWESVFSKIKCYSMNYKDKPYYSGASYLPEFVKLPDEHVNIHLTNIENIFDEKSVNKKEACKDYINKEFSLPNIAKAVETVLTYK